MTSEDTAERTLRELLLAVAMLVVAYLILRQLG